MKENIPSVILEFWKKMSSIKELSFVANSTDKLGWNGRGTGVVVVKQEDANTLIFKEKGVWQPKNNADLKEALNNSVVSSSLSFGAKFSFHK